MVKSKLPPQSGSVALNEAVEPHPYKRGHKIFLKDLWKHVFMGKKTQEKGKNRRLHNYTFNTLKSRFACQHKKNYFED